MDDDESDYLKTERYKNRYMKIYRKIAQLRQEGSNLGRNMDRKVNILLSSLGRCQQRRMSLQKVAYVGKESWKETWSESFDQLLLFSCKSII